MPVKRPRKAVRADDGRLKANRPKTAAQLAHVPTRWEMLIAGDLTVDDLDDEEIRRGVTRNREGTFSGRPPKMVPQDLFRAMRAEFQRRVDAKFRESVDVAQQVLLEVAQSSRAPADARVKAATALLERAIGKVPDKVQQDVIVRKFEENISGLLADVEDNMVQGTVVSIRREEAS